MRILLHEFITSGALADQPLPPTLLQEGAAMRRAVAEDLARMPGVTVLSPRDGRVPPLGLAGVEEPVAGDRDAEATLYRAGCQSADRVLVIAPELGGELLRRVRKAVSIAGPERVLNAASLIATASDKWKTCERLESAGVPTIPTRLAVSDMPPAWTRIVRKPRDGAGSQDVHVFEKRPVPGAADLPGAIFQPFVPGRWLSCTVLFRGDGTAEPFPVAEQQIAIDGSCHYTGGRLPASGVDMRRVQGLALDAIRALATSAERLIGPVGVDFVERAEDGELLVCEVNPRFTTSYVGARRLALTNLLAGLLEPAAPRACWATNTVVEFSADGLIRAGA